MNDVEFVQVTIEGDDIKMAPKKKDKQLSLDDFTKHIFNLYVGLRVPGFEQRIPVIIEDHIKYTFLKSLYDIEGLSQNAASTRIKNMGVRDEFINPLKECSYDDVRRSPQVSKYLILEKKRGSPYILISLQDAIIYMSHAKSVQKAKIIKKALEELDLRLKIIEQLKSYFILEFEYFDTEFYSYCYKLGPEKVYVQYEKLWGSSQWKRMRRMRYFYDKFVLGMNLPALDKLTFHHPDYTFEKHWHHIASSGYWTLNHKQGPDKK